MKKTVLIIYSLHLFLFACQDELKEEVKFDVRVSSESGYWDRDTFVVKQSEKIVFDFSGNAEFISFFSGEEGHEYKMRDATAFSVDDISEMTLHFTTASRYQDMPNSLSLYFSDSFEGLSGNNKRTDSIVIENTDWINMTDKANFPPERQATRSASISITEYKDKKITIAFLYDTDRNDALQPQWTISDMYIETALQTGKTSIIRAVTMGFLPFDMYAAENPYLSLVERGYWDISNIAAAGSAAKVMMRASTVGMPVNKDWLISTPVKLNRRMPDKAFGIKSIADNMDTYAYSYQQAGLYVATFIASRINYDRSSEKVETVYVKITD